MAVIAGGLAAELYGLEVLDRGIEDFPFNHARFFVMERKTLHERSVPDVRRLFDTAQPGALLQVYW